MSEQPLPTSETDPSLPLYEFNEVVQGAAHEFAGTDSLYPPEDIGLAAELGDGTATAVVGELTIPIDLDNDLRAALIKFTSPNGHTGFSLAGIGTLEDGKPWLNGMFAHLTPGEELRIGRQVTPEPGVRGLTAEELWPGRQYGELTSRNHAALKLTTTGVEAMDTSTNGTGMHGFEVVPDDPYSTAPRLHVETSTPADPVATEIAAMTATVRQTGEQADDLEIIPISGKAPENNEALVTTEEPSVTPEAVVPQQYRADREAAEKFNPAQAAMDELTHNWGLKEGITPADAAIQLENSLSELQTIHRHFGREGDVEQTLDDFRVRLYNTLDANIAHFNEPYLRQVVEVCSSLRNEVQRLMDAHHTGLLLPRTTLQGYEQPLYQLQTLMSVVEHFEGYGGRLEMDAVQSAYGLLQGNGINEINTITYAIETQIEEMRAELVGFAATQEGDHEGVGRYADERIAELAHTLQQEGAGDYEVQSAVAAMERYLQDAIGDKSSKLPWPSRITNDQMTPRRGGMHKGVDAPSRLVTAEMAVDMLRGAFNIEGAADQITIRSDGTVDVGQHRAAALMLLYGKNWLEQAKAQGFKWEQRT